MPHRFRTAILLIASYVFYMSWKPVYGILILALTVVNYLCGLGIAKYEKQRKPLLALTIIANLLVLAYFKYAYFTLESIGMLISPFGLQAPSIAMQIILPLAISFFTFEFIHYTVDVYRGSAPVKSFWKFALFPSFFPTQIAGPIKRYQDFIPQLDKEKRFKIDDLDEGFKLIILGLFKKVIFADNLSLVVQSSFSNPELLTSLDLWLAVYAFAFQIYFDFSGYTDIARGSAQILGFKVPVNFNLPYLAGSITEFWHRWHISLSTWLRDYLYIPLGGSRCSELKSYRNLFVTMLLGGLWHGAAMHFVVWGAYHGLCLIIHKEYKKRTEKFEELKRFFSSTLGRALATVFTFHVVCIGWVFFRAETFESAVLIIKRLFLLEHQVAGSTLLGLDQPIMFMILPVVLVALFLSHFLANRQIAIPKYVSVIGFAVMVCLLMVLSPDASPQFIYFQF